MWILVVGPASKLSACRFLVSSAPLLEEERCFDPSARPADLIHPRDIHAPRLRTRFAPDYCPMNTRQVQISDRTYQWLKRDKPCHIRNGSKKPDPISGGLILDRRA